MKSKMWFVGLALISSTVILSACQTSDPSKVRMGGGVQSVATKAGKPVLLTNILNYNPDCSIGRSPTVKVVSGPSHGGVQFKNVAGMLPKGPENAPNQCHSRRIAAIASYYTPAAGFTGSDKVTISAQLAGQPQNFDFFTFNITVSK